MLLSDEQLSSWVELGYVIIDGMVEDAGPPRAAAALATARARANEWEHGVRTAKTPFPPYCQDAAEDVWAVHSIIHPDLGDDTLLDWYGSEAVRSACAQLLGVELSDLQLELANLLVNPTRIKFGLPWHRDIVPSDATEEEEIAALSEGAREQTGVQWNTALYDDACFICIPGSHRRPRTATERAATDPSHFGANTGDNLGELSDQLVVELKAGQTIFYNPNLLHRGTYDPTVQRATLHCSIGKGVEHGGELRAANLSHVLGRDKMAWLATPGDTSYDVFRAKLSADPERAPLLGMHDQLLASLDKARREGLVAATDDDDARIVAYRELTRRQEERAASKV